MKAKPLTPTPFDADIECDSCGHLGAYIIEGENICINCCSKDVFEKD